MLVACRAVGSGRGVKELVLSFLGGGLASLVWSGYLRYDSSMTQVMAKKQRHAHQAVLPSVVVTLLLLLGSPAWADYEGGMDAYQKGDYATALKEFRPLGDRGHAKAQYNLGLMYARALGVPLDYGLAAQWLERAAKQGLAPAQSNLAVLYVAGRGVPQDYNAAAGWFERAADQGLAAAQYHLGVLYGNGLGVGQDYEVAAQWFRRAAEQGDTAAQSNLGIVYATGRGIRKDTVQAYLWLSLAAAKGSETARKNRDIVGKNMTPAQIAAGERLAREWKPKRKALKGEKRRSP